MQGRDQGKYCGCGGPGGFHGDRLYQGHQEEVQVDIEDHQNPLQGILKIHETDNTPYKLSGIFQEPELLQEYYGTQNLRLICY